MISLARVLISHMRLRGCIEAPIWRHRGTNDGYHKSVTVVVVTAVANDVVAGCMAAVTVPEEMDKTEEDEVMADKVRRLITVLAYRIQLVILQLVNGPA